MFFCRRVVERLLKAHVTPPLDGCTYMGMDSGAPPIQVCSLHLYLSFLILIFFTSLVPVTLHFIFWFNFTLPYLCTLPPQTLFCFFLGLHKAGFILIQPYPLLHPFIVFLSMVIYYLQISLFLDLLMCLCSDLSESEFVNGERTGCSSPISQQGAVVRSARALLWRILRGTTLHMGMSLSMWYIILCTCQMCHPITSGS